MVNSSDISQQCKTVQKMNTLGIDSFSAGSSKEANYNVDVSKPTAVDDDTCSIHKTRGNVTRLLSSCTSGSSITVDAHRVLKARIISLLFGNTKE